MLFERLKCVGAVNCLAGAHMRENQCNILEPLYLHKCGAVSAALELCKQHDTFFSVGMHERVEISTNARTTSEG